MSNLFGISLAVISNIMFGLRNIAVKKLIHHGDGRLISVPNRIYLLAYMSISALALLIWMVLGQALKGEQIFILETHEMDGLLLDSIISGISHVFYSIISITVMLSMFSVVTHATVNLGKRLFISLLFYLIGWQPPSIVNVAFGFIFLLGLVIHSKYHCLKPGKSSFH